MTSQQNLSQTTTHKTPEITSRTLQVGKRKIHLTELGSGYPVLMLHGGGPGASGLSNYPRNIQALAQHFRVLVPDMPGFGQSSKGLSRKDPFGDLAQGMTGLLDELEIESAHMVGNSLGGACGLRIALDDPQRVTSLVLMGPGGINTTRALPTEGLKWLLNYYQGDGPSYEKMRKFICEYLIYDGVNVVPDELVRERYEATVNPELKRLGQLQRPSGIPNPRKWDFTRDPRLDHCQTPTLVLWGTEDLVNRPSGGRALQKRMPNCDLYLFSKTGHWVQWERADEFNAITTAFMQNHTPA